MFEQNCDEASSPNTAMTSNRLRPLLLANLSFLIYNTAKYKPFKSNNHISHNQSTVSPRTCTHAHSPSKMPISEKPWALEWTAG